MLKEIALLLLTTCPPGVPASPLNLPGLCGMMMVWIPVSSLVPCWTLSSKSVPRNEVYRLFCPVIPFGWTLARLPTPLASPTRSYGKLSGRVAYNQMAKETTNG